ncbi:putative signaling protein [Pseudomonas fluorescens]|uniref:putative bifunctional diguanylate cyclase/phosphodiesterase n=1 Tax=Pseudomonas fluorescens TaxID=294 RepID=UPI00123F078C|nr:bifunctional diguanylate cyclase/phosphodiesterase [Pseudomonas fluorescens]VVM74147.1 putative signaling protein [Pseudomonas fluorescens]
MSTPVEPLRLLLLADEPEWAASLRDCLQPLAGSAVLLTAPNWEAVNSLFAHDRQAVVLATPALLPTPGRCELPTIVLLDDEPEAPPAGVSDWLVLAQLSSDSLRRSLRHVDLDNFRHVNDALGHQGGDRLILQVVTRLKLQLEAGDQLARLGSDEFALLIDTRREPNRAEWVAERIVEALGEPYWVDGESLLVGCSLGLAHARAQAGADPLMWHAHIAMRQAKSVQGCSFHVFNERINRNARSLADLEGELRRALRRDELELHYQPRLNLVDGRIVGLEALVRWNHPERGLLPPSEFVPLAEQSGLIVPLGYWVISRALRDMQGLREHGIAPLHMAVNLSFRQFQDSQLLATLSRLIIEHGVDARWLEFELTETAVMRRNELVRQTMDALGRLGVRFSLDDFGTGFSSFVHLNSLPITLLKVDRSFVGGMELREENRKLVHAMINLAHNLNLEVVAEGVESEEQMALLRGFGCDQVQGFLVSQPLPVDELVTYLQQVPVSAIRAV